MTDRDLKPNRHRDRDYLLTDIRPSRVYITERDVNPVDIGIRTVYVPTTGHLEFISPKGTGNQIDIGIRTFYGPKSGPLRFISPKVT